jgi:hypothetical protein
LQVIAYEYFSKSYGRTFGVIKGKPSKRDISGSNTAFGQWKHKLYFAASDGNGGLVPSEIERIKSWSVSDFLDLVEYKLEDADSRRK